MRLRISLGLIFATGAAFAQTAPAIAPGAAQAEARVIAKANPATRAWVKQEAGREAAAPNYSDAMTASAAGAFLSGGGAPGMDIDSLMLLVTMEAARDSENDLKSMLDDLRRSEAQKQAQRQAAAQMKQGQSALSSRAREGYAAQRPQPQGQQRTIATSAALDAYLKSQNVNKDEISDLSETDQHRLQMATDRRSKFQQTLSNILKKMSDTQSAIIQNLK